MFSRTGGSKTAACDHAKPARQNQYLKRPMYPQFNKPPGIIYIALDKESVIYSE